MARILIVEDEQHLLDLYRMELEDEGYEIQTANSAENAIKTATSFLPELIVLDIKLGETEGLEVLRKFKAQNKDIPVILNSAYSHYKNEFTSWLADAYITKSSDLTELKDKISEFLKPIRA